MLNLTEIKDLTFPALIELSQRLGIDGGDNLSRHELLYRFVRSENQREDAYIYGEGYLEIMQDGYGFLRSAENDYLPGSEDIYVSPSQIKLFHLLKGDKISGQVRPPKNNEKYFAMLRVVKVNDIHPQDIKNRVPFEKLTPLYPMEHIHLEDKSSDVSMRIMDLIDPIGKGQRGLIVSPPKAGKTILLQKMANSIIHNHPEIHLIVLLIDERPEEVTDMERSVPSGVDVISSTFDEPAERHVQVVEMVIERAKRLVEMKKDVAILLDSITRMARAYNTVTPHSGRILTGGVDASTLQYPKHFFGAARNIEEGGSLTIIATALVETGSKMDDVIFEEFKGTGNMEIILDRRLSDRRIFPAIDINRSGTRKEELLLPPDVLQRVWLLRKILADMNTVDAMEFMKEKLLRTKTNVDFLKSMAIS